jgi:two-component system sensor histidine kinase YesM
MKRLKAFFQRARLINVSIRSKLLLIYLLCVLIPSVVFSYAFYSSTMASTRKEKLILFQQSVDRIAGAVSSNAMSAIELSNIIYPDEAMYEYINRTYVDKKECLDDYNGYLQRAWDKILPYNTNIVLFTVFTDNETLLNGKHLHRVDGAVKACDWYGKYARLGKKAAFLSHFDEVISSTASVRLVSYIRRLDYFRNAGYTHIIKITFQANMLEKLMRAETLPGDIYVVDGDGAVVASTGSMPGGEAEKEFPPFSAVPLAPGRIRLESAVAFMEGWRVVCALHGDFMADAVRINWSQMLLLVLSTTLFASVVIYAIASSFYKRISLLVEHMGKVAKEEYELIPEKEKGSDEVGLLITSLNRMITKIRLLIEDVYKAKLRETQLELLKKQSELNALQCQVNPHFMFNVLETIRIKSYLRNEFETARIVKYMSRIFRKLLLWNDDLIALREEAAFIKEYLEIQQYRYEEELDFEISVDERLNGLKIPKMTLQTFVDNACEHGFSESKGLKKVRVSAAVQGDMAVLSVSDNGKGMTKEQIRDIENTESRGIGIRNVVGRLALYYGGSYRFAMLSEPGRYTEAVLTLDLKELKRSGYV